MNDVQEISDNEKVVRILHRDWVVEGQLQINAFSLRPNETYISVNRPSVETFMADVSDFTSKHTDFLISDQPPSFRQASLIVGKVRSIDVKLGQEVAEVTVEVEPRDIN